MIGTTLAHYEVKESLGAGGMGEVYRATDTKLDREVALKVLPDSMAGDSERVARFQREAKVLASLNHPHIAAIHGFEEAEGKRFLVLELVEGPTLAERLKAGPLMVEESLDIARQIAEALEAAHERGIVHRDLKPANIKLTPDGKVKVLDFGLAKALVDEDAHADPTSSPTITEHFTQPGVILGTAAYMSPEQARGRRVDKRTDIWAFGCVLYECLTGVSIFAGETVTDSVGAVLHKQPDWDKLPTNTPPTIQLLLRRCLAKDRQRRLRDIGDVRLELEAALADPSSSLLGVASAALSRAEGRSKKIRTTLAAAAIFLLGGLFSAAFLQTLGRAPGVNDSQNFPLRKFDLIVDIHSIPGPGQNLWPAISPDGRRIVYQSKDALWIRELDKRKPRQLFAGEGVSHPFWSPTSDQIGFFYNDKLWRISVAGGNPVMVSPIPRMPSLEAGGGAWPEEAEVIIAISRVDNPNLLRVAAHGGDPEPLIQCEKDEYKLDTPSSLPGQRGLLFVVHRIIEDKIERDTIAVHSSTGRKVIYQQDGEKFRYPVYSPTGHIIFQRDSTNPGIWAIPFSLEQLKRTGQPFKIAEGGHPSVASDGTLIYNPGERADTLGQAVWVDREGTVLETIGTPQPAAIHPRISPDGKLLSISADEGEEGRRIWIHDIARGTRDPLSMGWLFHAWLPTQGNDDGALLEIVATDVSRRVWRLPVDGTGSPQEIGNGGYLSSVSNDGRFLLFTAPAGGQLNSLDIAYLALNGETNVTPLLATDASEQWATLSPNGRFMAYHSDDDIFVSEVIINENELAIGGRQKVSTSGGGWPQWSPVGNELFYLSEDHFMSVKIDVDARSIRLGKPLPLFELHESWLYGYWQPYDVDSDGERFLFVQYKPDLADEDGALQTITVVQNWFGEYEDRRAEKRL